MIILAFLQNMWVRDPARLRAMIQKHGHPFRRKFLTYALFAGCLTGRRLREAFGPHLCEDIIWEEASPVICDNPNDYCEPDPGHIQSALVEHKPDIVICLTRRGEKIIREAVQFHDSSIDILFGPHPAARGPQVMDQLFKIKHRLLVQLHPGEFT